MNFRSATHTHWGSTATLNAGSDTFANKNPRFTAPALSFLATNCAASHPDSPAAPTPTSFLE